MASKKRGRISKAFKREVAIEYIQGGGTMQEIALKYNLLGYTRLRLHA